MSSPLENNPNNLLMRAILSQDPKEVVDSWRSWRAITDWDTIPYEAFMVIPFLYKNLVGKTDDPDLAKYRGAYRLAWVRNNMLFSAIKPVLSDLNEAGLEPVLLKGAALAIRYYPSSDLRPLTDADIWVPRERFFEAADILENLGWKVSGRRPRNRTFQKGHAAVFTNAAGLQIDLHWRFIWCARDSVNDHFRKETVSIRWQEIVVRMFRPETMFLHVCVHGARSGEYSRFRGGYSIPGTLQWNIDCAQILSDKKQEFDWGAVIEESLPLNAYLQLRYALERLARHQEIEIPQRTFERLDSLDVSLHARAHFALTVNHEDEDDSARQRRCWYGRLLDDFLNEENRDLDPSYLGTPALQLESRHEASEPLIPAVAHFLWLEESLPGEISDNIDRFRNLHPDWKVVLWRTMPEELPEDLQRGYAKAPTRQMAADLLRFWVLKRHGGMVIDARVFAVRSFSRLRYCDHFLVRERTQDRVSPAVVGAAPESEFAELALERIRSGLRAISGGLNAEYFRSVMLTKLVQSHPERYHVLPFHYFNAFDSEEAALEAVTREQGQPGHVKSRYASLFIDGTAPYGINTQPVTAFHGGDRAKA